MDDELNDVQKLIITKIEEQKENKRNEYDAKFFRKLVLVSIMPAAVVTARLLGNEISPTVGAVSNMFSGVQVLYAGEYVCEMFKRYQEDYGKQKTIGGLNRWE